MTKRKRNAGKLPPECLWVVCGWPCGSLRKKQESKDNDSLSMLCLFESSAFLVLRAPFFILRVRMSCNHQVLRTDTLLVVERYEREKKVVGLIESVCTM